MNERGELVSWVADDNGVVGHYALELGRDVAETGMAMVSPGCRGKGLMNELRAALEGEAVRRGHRAIFGTPVTDHPFSQRAYERLGNQPCGLLFRRYVDDAGCAHHTLVYFKFLDPAARTARRLHVPTEWQSVVGEIYRSLGCEVGFERGEAPEGSPFLDAGRDSVSGVGSVRVHRLGDVDAVLEAARGLDAGVTQVEFPVCEPGCDAVWRAAEGEGFFFGAVIPLLDAGRDVVVLQKMVAGGEEGPVVTDSPRAKEVARVVQEARRAREDAR
jgi:hypothetical protein